MAHCLATVEAASLLIPLPFPMAEIIHSPCDIRCRRGPILAESPVLSPRGQALTLSASDPQHPRQVLEPGADVGGEGGGAHRRQEQRHGPEHAWCVRLRHVVDVAGEHLAD